MFAFHLSRAGHEVTVIGRGKRLEALQRDQAICAADSAPAPVRVSGALDPSVAYDLVLVTMFETQVESILPALQASQAKMVMFMFNTFKLLAPWRAAVGEKRFAFGFPTLPARLVDGKLERTTVGRAQRTAVTDAACAQVFNDAGLPTDVVDDMQSYLRAHAAAVVPMMKVGCIALRRGAGITWAEAQLHARAMDEGFALVRHMGHTLIPAPIAVLARLPRSLKSGLLWSLSRTAPGREVGELGNHEPHMLIDDMVAVAAPEGTAALMTIREA